MPSRWSPRHALGLVLLVLAAGPTPVAAAAAKPPKLTGLRCVPANAPACARSVHAAAGDTLQLRGSRLASRQRVTFTWPGGQTAAKVKRRRGVGWTVQVPVGTELRTVRVAIWDRRGRRSNRVRLRVTSPPPALAAHGVDALPQVFSGTGLWIVELAEADGGGAGAIAARARVTGSDTVFIKSHDGATPSGGQFTAALVAQLHAGGVQVCAWQYAYGTNPEAEAAAAVSAVQAGADCLVVNAEIEYSGRYDEARRYLRGLRAAVGERYPVGFTSFALPTSHPDVPYSVFLGPGGAQANLPQVYWQEFGVPVAALSAQVAAGNRIYGRPIAPVGQTYGTIAAADVQAFRARWAAYGATGRSWYRWGLTAEPLWAALAAPAPAAEPLRDPGWQTFAKGSSGDGVRWLQQHLKGVAADGVFGAGTETALRRFQRKHKLRPTGATGPLTWEALLRQKAGTS